MEKILTLRQDGFDCKSVYESSERQGEEGRWLLGPSQQPLHRSVTHRFRHRCLHHAQYVGPDQVLGPGSFHGEPCQIHQQLLLGKKHFFVLEQKLALLLSWINFWVFCSILYMGTQFNSLLLKSKTAGFIPCIGDIFLFLKHCKWICFVLNWYNFECYCCTGEEYLLPTLSRGNSPTRRRKRPYSLLSMDSLHPSGTGEYFVLWSWPWIDPDLVSDLEIYVWHWHIVCIWFTMTGDIKNLTLTLTLKFIVTLRLTHCIHLYTDKLNPSQISWTFLREHKSSV